MIRMRIKTDITALGELLIDFTPAGVSQQGMRLFEQNPGGAPANLLAAAAKFGRKTAFIVLAPHSLPWYNFEQRFHGARQSAMSKEPQ